MAKATKLTAINTIISNIGQSPITTLDTGNPLVVMAEQVLDEISRAVQGEGWVFNTEYRYPFTPDPQTGFITIPDNVLALANPPYEGKATIRGSRLYNKADHTYVFTGQQDLDVVWLFEFDEIPEAFKNYITIRAANVFAGRSVGSVEAVRFGEREEVIARATAIEYDTQQGDYSVFSDNNNRNPFYSYRPVNALYRY
jgi:hypothetical protein